MIGIAIAAAFMIWAVGTADGWTPTYIVDRLESGRVTRFLLGLVLGVGAAYIIEQRQGGLLAAQLSLPNATPWGVADWSAALSVAAAVTLLAVFSPNIDGWLSRISSVKTAVVEFQVHGEATRHVEVASNAETSSSASVLNFLKLYSLAIKNDFLYMTKVQPHVPGEHVHSGDFTTKQEKLQVVFEKFIAPFAECIDGLMKEQLSIASIRLRFQDIGEKLEKIVMAARDDEYQRENFWISLTQLPYDLSKLAMGKVGHGCNRMTYVDEHPNIYDKTYYPLMKDYANLPYFYVASSLLMHFLQDDDVSLNILEVYRNKMDFWPDHLYFKLLAKLRSYQGQNTERVIRPLEDLLKMTHEHLSNIEKYCQDCKDTDIKALTFVEKKYELVAMNNYAYFVAEDLARRIKGADQFSALAEYYALRVKEAADKGLPEVEDSANDFLDTYAYTTIVLESRKEVPSVDTFKKMSHLLERVVSTYERKPANNHFDGAALKSARVHWASARELAGE